MAHGRTGVSRKGQDICPESGGLLSRPYAPLSAVARPSLI